MKRLFKVVISILAVLTAAISFNSCSQLISKVETETSVSIDLAACREILANNASASGTSSSYNLTIEAVGYETQVFVIAAEAISKATTKTEIKAASFLLPVGETVTFKVVLTSSDGTTIQGQTTCKIASGVIPRIDLLSANVSSENVTSVTVVINGSNSLYINDSLTLEAKDQDGRYITDIVEWTSADESVATVSGGVVTGVGEGNAEISANLKKGDGTVLVGKQTVSVSRLTNVTSFALLKKAVNEGGDYNISGTIECTEVLYVSKSLTLTAAADTCLKRPASFHYCLLSIGNNNGQYVSGVEVTLTAPESCSFIIDGNNIESCEAAVINGGSTLTCTNVAFKNNTSCSGPGALQIADSTVSSSTVLATTTLTNCSFTNNKNTSYGDSAESGGAVLSKSVGISTFENCTFTGNSCVNAYGGAVAFNNANGYFYGCTLGGSSTDANSAVNGSDAAIIDSCIVKFESTSCLSDTASESCGNVYFLNVANSGINILTVSDTDVSLGYISTSSNSKNYLIYSPDEFTNTTTAGKLCTISGTDIILGFLYSSESAADGFNGIVSHPDGLSLVYKGTKTLTDSDGSPLDTYNLYLLQ